MPYIPPVNRGMIDQSLGNVVLTSYGELNYAATVLANRLLDGGWLSQREPGYTEMQGIVGCLVCAALEFYRRRLAPYEDLKIAENGDLKFYRKEESCPLPLLSLSQLAYSSLAFSLAD